MVIEIARNQGEFERALYHSEGRVAVPIQDAIGKRAVIRSNTHRDAAFLAKIYKWRKSLPNTR